MVVSILHISDLHRDHDAPLANRPLLESLLSAMRRLESLEPPIPEPDLIVVSGDVVFGIGPTEDPGELAAQYAQAEELLGALANELVSGVRDRVVIVPGNHDVSFPAFLGSLERVAASDRDWANLLPQLFELNSPYRWSWRERALYRIRDLDAYHRRLEAFQSFYDTFYGGVRTFSLDPRQQYEIFDYPELELTVVAYSSCHTNDPWHRLGSIHSEAIAASSGELRHVKYGGRAVVGVWHHCVSNPPHQPDFMDEDRVQLMLTEGFTLGLHGHQHRAEQVHTTSRFGFDGWMAVISAGTLCGGAGALPPGRPRSFNVIELDLDEEVGRVHVHNMVNDDLASPLWRRHAGGNDGSAIAFPLRRLPVSPGKQRREVLAAISQAQALIAAREYERARDILLPHVDDALARRTLFEALSNLDDHDTVIAVFDPPQSPAEQLRLMDAFWEAGRNGELRELLNRPQIREAIDAAVIETRESLRRKLDLS